MWINLIFLCFIPNYIIMEFQNIAELRSLVETHKYYLKLYEDIVNTPNAPKDISYLFQLKYCDFWRFALQAAQDRLKEAEEAKH